MNKFFRRPARLQGFKFLSNRGSKSGSLRKICAWKIRNVSEMIAKRQMQATGVSFHRMRKAVTINCLNPVNTIKCIEIMK